MVAVSRKPPKSRRMTPDAKNAQQGFSDCAPVATSHDEREQVSKALSRLCKMAAAVMDADRATLWLWQAGVTRKIASHGCDIPFRSLNWDFDAVDYQPDQRVVIAHALKDVEREAQVTTGSERPVAFLCRVPVAVAPNYVASLIIFAESPRASPPPGELHIVNEIAALMKCEFDRIKQVLLERPNTGKVPALERQLFEKVMSSSNRVFLLDAKLVIRAVSDNAASILGDTPGSLVGRPYLDWESVLGISVAYFLKHSLMQGTCTSDLEVDFPARNGIPGAWTLRATPVTPSDTEERYLYVSIQALFDSIPAPPTGRPLCRSSYDAGSIPLLQPTADLLFSTLVQRRSIRARDGVNYLSIRSWRQPIREFQIAALKALKNNPGC